MSLKIEGTCVNNDVKNSPQQLPQPRKVFSHVMDNHVTVLRFEQR